jgi:hypothetical protein
VVRRGQATAFTEYDLFYRLTGICALLLRHHPSGEELAGILRYVVTLTTQSHDDDLPGWWVAHNTDKIIPASGEYAKLEMATVRPDRRAVRRRRTLSFSFMYSVCSISAIVEYIEKGERDGQSC